MGIRKSNRNSKKSNKRFRKLVQNDREEEIMIQKLLGMAGHMLVQLRTARGMERGF